jgi:phosphomannomutase
MKPELIIGISGVRGIIGENLGPTEGVEFGLAYGTFLQEQSLSGQPVKIAIGRDSRISGSMLAQALSSGLMATGCETIDLGIVTTPGTALMACHLECDGAIVITASHNPIEWNGIKFLSADGVAYPVDQVRKIHQHYHKKTFALKDSVSVGSARVEARTHGLHIQSVLKLCDKTLISSKRFKVVLDSVNGAGCVVTATLLSDLGCECIHLNDRPDGHFPHPPEPIAENLADLGPEILKHKAAIGFAQDPDADRLVVIDEKGNFIGEEYTLALVAKYIFSKKKGSAVVNLSTSRMIDDLAVEAGCSVIRTSVGEAHVAQAMRENDCIIGGEGNGGVIDLRVGPVRNSLVGIVLVLQLLAETGKTVSELIAEIPAYHMAKTKYPCKSGQACETLDRVKAHYEKQKGDDVKVDTRDGIRVDLAEGWVQLRASNTEPIIRLMAESSDEKATNALIEQIRRIAQL